ncbi:MAG TPA: methyltransferase domain-containing protein [Gemmatimonadaceae bacterium]|jgi:trans-aconitate 2-methyltransferase
MTDERPPSSRWKEWNAAAYHALSEPQFAWGLRVLERTRMAGNECVLDAGCGSGRLTRELASQITTGFVLGCDLSENMAHAAAETLGSMARCAVACANLMTLPFTGVFDLIFSTATFHWIRDHDRLFLELRAALRSGGRLEAQCGGGPNLATIHARADTLKQEEPFRRHFEHWQAPWLFASPAETEGRLRRAGFASARCWLEQTPTPFADAAHFRAFVESVVMRPYILPLPDDLQGRFLDSIVGQAAKDDPPFTLDYWRLNISATTI